MKNIQQLVNERALFAPLYDLAFVNGVEWEVTTAPAVYLKGKMQTVRFHKPGDPSVTNVEHMPAHERVAVRRAA